MTKEKDITNLQYGLLTAIKKVENRPKGGSYWLFRCECGKEVIRLKTNVVNVQTTSCGCLMRGRETHGFFVGKDKKDPCFKLYHSWTRMKQNCYNKNSRLYGYFGAKGIKVSDSWLDYGNFYRDVIESYREHSAIHGEKRTFFGMKDKSKDYSVDNYLWQTPNQNKKKNVYRYKGKLYTMTELVKEFGITSSLFFCRMRSGYTIADVIEGNYTRKIKDKVVNRFNYYKKHKKHFVGNTAQARKVLKMLYGGKAPRTMADVGFELGVSKQRIDQIVKHCTGWEGFDKFVI